MLTRPEAFAVLEAVEEAVDQLATARVFTLVIQLLGAAELLTNKLFPDLPRGS